MAYRVVLTLSRPRVPYGTRRKFVAENLAPSYIRLDLAPLKLWKCFLCSLRVQLISYNKQCTECCTLSYSLGGYPIRTTNWNTYNVFLRSFWTSLPLYIWPPPSLLVWFIAHPSKYLLNGISPVVSQFIVTDLEKFSFSLRQERVNVGAQRSAHKKGVIAGTWCRGWWEESRKKSLERVRRGDLSHIGSAKFSSISLKLVKM